MTVEVAAVVEALTWYPVPERMPDADETVLLFSPLADEPVWVGYWDGECWRDMHNAEVTGEVVTFYTRMPGGPE